MSPASPTQGAPAKVVRYSESDVPTERGVEHFVIYHERRDDPRADLATSTAAAKPEALFEHIAVVVGEPHRENPALIRVHSECVTGEVFGSLKCDCGPQLQLAFEAIHKKGDGAVLYLRQEGRGIGLGNKLRAYALQGHGADTVDANTKLGLPVDARDYAAAAMILKDLGLTQVALMTNNPEKVTALQREGIEVAERIPLVVESGEHNRAYLDTKRIRLGHALPEQEQPEQKQPEQEQ